MEATLLTFIFHQASALVHHLQEYLGKHPLEVYFLLFDLVAFALREVNVADVKRGSVKVGGIFRGVHVAALEAVDAFLRAQQRGHVDFVIAASVLFKFEIEGLADVMKQKGRGLYEEGVRMRERADCEIFTAFHLHYGARLPHDVAVSPDRGNAQVARKGQMRLIEVIKLAHIVIDRRRPIGGRRASRLWVSNQGGITDGQ